MENIIARSTSRTWIDQPLTAAPSVQTSTSSFGMPMAGAFACAAFGTQPISADFASAVVRDRKDVAAKGHLGLVAYVPGYHAWSPPLC